MDLQSLDLSVISGEASMVPTLNIQVGWAQESSIVFHLFDNHALIDLKLYIAYLTITFMLNHYTNDI